MSLATFGLPIPEPEAAAIVCAIFDGLPADALSALDKSRLHYQVGRRIVLFSEGQKANGIYVCSGEADLLVNSRQGSGFCVQRTLPGAALGLQACLTGGRFEAAAESHTRCGIDFYPRAVFLELLNLPRLARNVCFELAQQALDLQARVREGLLDGSVEARLARLLLEDRKACHLSHEGMSISLGCSRETVTRVLNQWARSGWVRRALSGAGIELMDTMALQGKLA